MGLGEEVDLAIFVRDGGKVVAGIADGRGATAASCRASGCSRVFAGPGWPPNSSRLPKPRRPRGCSQTVHFTYGFQAQALYEQNGYEVMGRVEDFPSGTDTFWYRKRLRRSDESET